MSITMCDAPMAFFLLRIDGSSIGSIPSGYSTWMKRSSAGASSKDPPQTRHPLVFFTTVLISSMERFTGQRASTRSAVPAGEVIALEEVLGMVYPAAATIGTTNIDVLSPGMPPTLCLSRIGVLPKSSVLPVFIIALDRASVSAVLNPCMLSEVRKAAISTVLKWRSTTSCTIAKMSFSCNRSPRSLALMLKSDSGKGASCTLTVSASFTPRAATVSL